MTFISTFCLLVGATTFPLNYHKSVTPQASQSPTERKWWAFYEDYCSYFCYALGIFGLSSTIGEKLTDSSSSSSIFVFSPTASLFTQVAVLSVANGLTGLASTLYAVHNDFGQRGLAALMAMINGFVMPFLTTCMCGLIIPTNGASQDANFEAVVRWSQILVSPIVMCGLWYGKVNAD